MKYLIMFLLSLPASANVSCYTYGTITNCSDGTSMYDYGSMKQIMSPNQAGATTVYQYGNQTQITSPNSYQSPQHNYPRVNPLLQPLQGLPSLR
jgi:hypothetical protein